MEAEWIPIKEAAKLLEISERQVLNRIHTGKLKAKREGRLWLVHSSLSEPIDEAESLPERFANETIKKLEETVELLKEQTQQKDKQLEKLQEQLSETRKAAADASERSDTIVLQLTRQLEQSQRLLEYHEEPWYRRWFRKGRSGDTP